MDGNVFLTLARRGVRMPIGADLVLNEDSDPESIRNDAEQLGRVVERAARRYGTPLAFPLMDLTLEKADLLRFFEIPEGELDAHQFDAPPSEEQVSAVWDAAERPFRVRNAANIGAVRYIAERTDLLPVGMLIGPFSLMTKLTADPITAVAMAGNGVAAEDDEGVRLVERCLDMALATVLRSATAQIRAGAKVMIVCEPAVNRVYLSPVRLRSDSDIFQRFVVAPNRWLRSLLPELTTDMVRRFATELLPQVTSLGSSRCGKTRRAICRRNASIRMGRFLHRKCGVSRWSWSRRWRTSATRTSWAPSATCCTCSARRRQSGTK